jgi:hypothetical protein
MMVEWSTAKYSRKSPRERPSTPLRTLAIATNTQAGDYLVVQGEEKVGFYIKVTASLLGGRDLRKEGNHEQP